MAKKKKKKKKDAHNRRDAEVQAPLAHRDITLPRRQPSRGYVQPDLPLRHIPTPF
jgi:hypothetical protein